MMHKRKTSSTHASTFLVTLALVNMSAMEEPHADTGVAASRAVGLVLLPCAAMLIRALMEPATAHPSSPHESLPREGWGASGPPPSGDLASDPGYMRC